MDDNAVIRDFVKYVGRKLHMEELPRVKISRDARFSLDHKTFGIYLPDQRMFTVEVHGRNIIDVLRTVAHEMTHHKQNEDASTKSHTDLEIEATAAAGMLIKLYANDRPELYAQKPLR
jgi:uncharacterized lipoprotein NlpE involved in copper resistance